VEHRLQYIAPEQTGRMPAEPDSRTDIYSLGILFWTLLTGEPAFRGETPLEIMQALLSKRLPAVDSIRSDVPQTVSSVIHKMTQKNMDDRYHSSAGLKYDLQEIKRSLREGDSEAVAIFVPGSKDVSCFFQLPRAQIGRQAQRRAVIDVIGKAASRAAHTTPVSKRGLFSLSSHSSTAHSSERIGSGQHEEALSVSSDSTGDRDQDDRQNPSVGLPIRDNVKSQRESPLQRTSSSADNGDAPQIRDSTDSRISPNSYDGSSRPSGAMSSYSNPDGTLLHTAQKLKKRGHTEVLSIVGAAGLGKSSLLKTAQVTARKHGYYASAKFDQVKRAPFEPVLRVMSSIFRQVFSENDVNTEFHSNIRSYIKPYWSILSDYLDLPSGLLSQFSVGQYQSSPHVSQPSRQKCGAHGNTAADWVRQTRLLPSVRADWIVVTSRWLELQQ